MAESGLRIGIPVLGGFPGAEGANHVRALARSVHTLAPELRPSLHLVLQPETLPQVEPHLPFLDLFAQVILLLDPAASPERFHGHAFTVCSDREELYRHIDFFFPVLADGWADACSASWIPDFQHRHEPELFAADEIGRREAACARVAERARLVVLGSREMREDFCRFFPRSTARTRVLPLPAAAGDEAGSLRSLGEALASLAREACDLYTLAARRRAAASMDHGRALTAWQGGRPEEALAILEDVVAVAPDDARAWCTFGQVLAARGEGDRARDCFRTAIRVGPDSAEAVLRLGDSLIEGGGLEEACQVYYRFLDQEPDHGEVIAALVRAEERWADDLLGRSLIRDLDYRARPYLVTALVSTYASAAFMGECLEDLAAQTIADDLEVIVVDAASPEDEGAIVEAYQRRWPNIRYLRTPERIGIYPAWNLAARLARGEFLTSASTNDRLNPEAYAIMAAALRERPEVALVYGDSHLTDLPHQSFGRHTPSRFRGGAYRWPPFEFEDLLRGCLVGPHPMWRRSAHQEVGYFDGRYQAIGDQDFWNRLSWKRSLLHLPVFTGLAWITADSLSGRPSALAEIHEIKAKHCRYYQKIGRKRPLESPP